MKNHLYKCPVRWSDMDVYGVVNNVSIMRLLEEARVDFIWGINKKGDDAFFKDGSVVVSHKVKYVRPLTHKHKPVDIVMWVSSIKSASVTIKYRILDGDDLCSEAETVMAPYNYEDNYPRTMTDDERIFFENYLHESEMIL